MADINKPLLDLPFFELTNQAISATTATSGLATAEDGSSRFIYYARDANFQRYDTVTDTWQILANIPQTASNLIAMRYTTRRGFHGRVLSATSNTVTIPAMRGEMLDGEKISIEYGTGAGQERTLTFVSETVHDAGVATTASASLITDNTKKWRVNQWAGYTVGIYFGTDATHYRKILYNDATTLYVVDGNLQPHDPWNNQTYIAASPYAVPSATAGSQTNFMILSTTFSVDSNWNVTPDSTSYFTTRTGGVYLLTGNGSNPFFSFLYYDVANDIWQYKTTPQNLFTGQISTDAAIERTGKIGFVYLTGTASSATSRTITDSTLSLVNDRYANYRMYITSGTGRGQSRRIVAHNATTFTIPRNWDVTPDSTSTYEIWPDYDRIYLTGNATGTMLAYSPENDYWMQGQAFDDGITTNISATLSGWLPVGISTGTRIASGVTAVASTPTAGGTNYVIGDVLTCSVGGTGAQVRVTNIAPGGVVTAIELINSGTATGFTVGTGRATTGGTGTGCTIEITAVGATANITTASNHFFKTGDVITFAGCSEAAWNTAHTILGVPAVNVFSVAVTATANMAATASQSTTVIVDSTKSWVVNEHVGRLVHLMGSGQTPGSQVRWITANTANTLTVAAITAAGNGTSKYVIYDSKIFGVDCQRKETGMDPFGWATSGSTTTLVDSTKNWVPNQWAGYFFKVEAGTGYGSGRIQIISNTATTLTYATQTFTPDATTKYEIADTWGLASSGSTTTLVETGSKNWVTNQWAGKGVRITGGTNTGVFVATASNTNNTLTTGSVGATANDATSAYAIVGIPNRAAGTGLVWVWGNTNEEKRGKYIYSFRGGGTNQIDVYDITTGRWEYGLQFAPQGELFNLGSSYAYESGDTIYASRSTNNAPIRVLEIDTEHRRIQGKGTTTFLQGTATIGNFMEIVEKDGYKFLYILQNTGTLMCRALLW